MNPIMSQILSRVYFELIKLARIKNIEYNIIRNRTKGISGWILDDAGYELYKLCLMPTVKTVVELGSWQGKSSTWIASALKHKHDAMLFCVDTWAGSPDDGKPVVGTESILRGIIESNMQRNRLTSHVQFIEMTSAAGATYWRETQKTEIDVLFIDADHSYDAVRRDFELWSPFVTQGGVVVFDDVPSRPGPTRLCAELEATGAINVVGRTRNTLFSLKP